MQRASRSIVLAVATVASGLISSAASAQVVADRVRPVPGFTPNSRLFEVQTTGATALGAFTSANGNIGSFLVGYDRTTATPGADTFTYATDPAGFNPPDTQLYGVRVGNNFYTIPAVFSSGSALGSTTFVSVGGPPQPASQNDRISYSYHSTGSVNGIREALRAQGLRPATPFPASANNQLFVMGTANSTFVGTSSNGYTLPGTYNPTIAWSDVRADQGFAVDDGGTAAVNRAPTASGYGLGRSNQGIAGVNMQALANVSSINDAADNFAPGVATLTGRVRNEAIAVVPFTISANPGTGLDSIHENDAKMLQVSGRLQNGVNLNYATRDIGSGTRNQGGNNLNVDPSWASGERDRIATGAATLAPSPNGDVNISVGQEQSPERNLDGTITTTGNALVSFNEHRPSAISRFSDKLSGSTGIRQVVNSQRLGLGILSSGDVGIRGRDIADNTPLRVLAIDFIEAGSGAETTDNGPVQPKAIEVTEGQYHLWSASQAVTVNTIDGSGNVIAGNAIKGDIDDVSIATAGAQTGPGIARKFLTNITSSVASAPNPTTTATPLDGVIRGNFIPTNLMRVQKTFDGDVQQSRTLSTSEQAIYNAVIANPAQGLGANLNWLRAGDHTGGSSQRYRVYDVASNVAAALATGDLDIAINQATDTTGTDLAGDFTQNGVRDLGDVRAMARARADTAAYLGLPANAAITASSFSATANLDSSAISNAQLAGLLVLSDLNGDGNVVVRDALGADISLNRDLSNAAAFNAALGVNGGGNQRDRVEAISKKDIEFFLFGAAVDTDSASSTFDGTQTLASIYSNPLLLKGRTAGNTAQNQRELGVRYGQLRKNEAVIVYNDEIANIGAATTEQVERFDVNGDGVVNRLDAQALDRNVGRNFTNIADVLATSDDLIRAELNDNNVITHIDTNPASTVITAGLTSAQIRTQLGNDSDMKQIVDRLVSTGSLNSADVNLSGSTINSADLNIVVGNFGVPNRKWTQGDVRGFNGTVNSADLNAVVGAFSSVSPILGGGGAGTPGDNIADLQYNPSTGEVVIVPDNQIISFVLENDLGGIDFINTASILFPSSSILVDRDPLIIGWTDLSGFAATLPFSLGNILPNSLTLQQLNALFTTANVSRNLGDVNRFNIEVIPEPTVLGVMIAGAALAIRRRRR